MSKTLEGEMPEFLLFLNILATVGMLLIPLTAPTRGRAIAGWLSNFLVSVGFLYLLREWYSTWEEPAWRSSVFWFATSWSLLIAGLVVGMRKPRKRGKPVA